MRSKRKNSSHFDKRSAIEIAQAWHRPSTAQQRSCEQSKGCAAAEVRRTFDPDEVGYGFRRNPVIRPSRTAESGEDGRRATVEDLAAQRLRSSRGKITR